MCVHYVQSDENLTEYSVLLPNEENLISNNQNQDEAMNAETQ